MSTLIKKIVGAPSCKEEESWLRLAHPFSFYMRNLSLLSMITVLWFREDLNIWLFPSLFICALLARGALLVPKVSLPIKNWHVEAIMGEKLLSCDPKLELTTIQRRKLVTYKTLELVCLGLILYGLIFSVLQVIILSTFGFLLTRIGLLMWSRGVYRLNKL